MVGQIDEMTKDHLTEPTSFLGSKGTCLETLACMLFCGPCLCCQTKAYRDKLRKEYNLEVLLLSLIVLHVIVELT